MTLRLFSLCVAGAFAAAATTNDLLFLDNGEIRLGVKRSSGAGLAWFSAAGSGRNLVNHFDRGRLVQQSYYGRPDGSLWDRQPWTWNPVQGGDWKGRGAPVLELVHGTNWLRSKSIPVHWAAGTDVTNCVMEQSITLTGRVAHVRFRFTCQGGETHPVADQEIPAVFVEPDLDTLVLYDGDRPWTGGALHRSRPGWPNEARRMTEHWAAYVDAAGFGLGAYVPAATNLTCYRFGDGDAKRGACSYFAPLTRFAITPDFRWEYDLWLTLGTVEEIRAAFDRLHRGKR